MNEIQKWRASAASNIALIKYMGKLEGSGNRPTNTSLSFTLPKLKTFVEIEREPSLTADRWEGLDSFEGRSLVRLVLSEKGRQRFLSHFATLKKHFGVSENFIIRSANDFPSDCGLASSASSFAALTMAAARVLPEFSLEKISAPSANQAANLSRQGSGSSSRSFFAPWSIWDVEGAREVENLRDIHFDHQVVIVDSGVKAVSSSEAHRRVSSSELFRGRPERAEVRARRLVEALLKSAATNDWREPFEICWAEFWDMHALFETSAPSFGYMNANSLAVIGWIRDVLWSREGYGPLVTMDAGPNVHLLYPRSERGRSLARETKERFSSQFRVLSGAGE